MNPFDLTGPSFLLFYLALIAAGVVVALAARWVLRGPAAVAGESPPNLGPDEIACLAGGSKLASDVAIANLVQRGTLKADPVTKLLALGAESPRPASPVEAKVLDAVEERPEGITVADARR